MRKWCVQTEERKDGRKVVMAEELGVVEYLWKRWWWWIFLRMMIERRRESREGRERGEREKMEYKDQGEEEIRIEKGLREAT